MTLTAKEKRERAMKWKPHAKEIADKHCTEADWTNFSTFHAVEVSELIRQILLSLTKHEYEFEGEKVMKHFEVWKPQGRLQMIAIWEAIADNLRFGMDEDEPDPLTPEELLNQLVAE